MVRSSLDRVEAARIAAEIGEQVERRAPEGLRALLASDDVFEVTGRDGLQYRVSIEAWAELRDPNQLEVIVTVSDGTLRSEIHPASWRTEITLEP